MILQEKSTHIPDLISLASDSNYFTNPPLTSAELVLLHDAPLGRLALCGPIRNPKDPSYDPSKGDEWPPNRQIRADLIRWICVDRRAKELVDPRGIRVYGALIPDVLDLSHITIPFPLTFQHCRLMKELNLQGAEMPTLDLQGTWVTSIEADGATVNGAVLLRNGFRAEGHVLLLASRIGADLDCSGGTFNNPPKMGVVPTDPALSADRAVISGSVFFDAPFHSVGEVRLLEAQVGGDLSGVGGIFHNPIQRDIEGSGKALCADGAIVKGKILLRDKFSAEGEVRLPGVRIEGDLECDAGLFSNPIPEGSTQAGPALTADKVVIGGGVFCRHGFRSNGEVRFLRANISGDVDFSGSLLSNPARPNIDGTGQALAADGATLQGSVFLSNAHVSGAVVLINSQIEGELNCAGAVLRNPPQAGVKVPGHALSANGLIVKRDILLNDHFHADGEVQLSLAQVGGNLDISTGFLHNPFDPQIEGTGIALFADGITVRNIFCQRGFRADGGFRIISAQIGSNLGCDGGAFNNPARPGSDETGKALSADGAVVHQQVTLRNGFWAEGEVRLLAAEIGTDLSCDGGVFHNPFQPGLQGTGRAITADGAVVHGKVSLGQKFQADGEVGLIGVQIGGNIQCDGGAFSNVSPDATKRGLALDIVSATVQGNISLSNGFQSQGHVNILGTQIAGNLECTRAKFSGALNSQRSVIKGTLVWKNIIEPESTTLYLQNVSAGTLDDDPASWPLQGNIRLDGFVYGRISGGPTDATTRLKWLGLQKSFTPQPYRQLAKVLRDAGDESGAKTVLVAMERGIRADQWLVSPALRDVVDYGYNPLRAFWWLCGLSGIGWIIYRRNHLAGGMAPTEKNAYDYVKDKNPGDGSPPPGYPRFFPSIYSLENSLPRPLVKLGQADHWQPDPNPPNARRRAWNWMRHLRRMSRRWALLHPLFLCRVVLRLHVKLVLWVHHRTHRPGAKRFLFKIRLLLRLLIRWTVRLSLVTTSPRLQPWFLWAQILMGWILATLFVAGIAGIVRKD